MKTRQTRMYHKALLLSDAMASFQQNKKEWIWNDFQEGLSFAEIANKYSMDVSYVKARIEEMDEEKEDGRAYCPECGAKTESDHLSGFSGSGYYSEVSTEYCTSKTCEWGETW